jgi:beta-galactosidase
MRMARRIEDAGMGLLLNFHYSDYWADPQRQLKPAAWEDLDFETLKDALRDYTLDVVSELAAQGTPPAMVQVGNEINHGLLWPDGHISSLDNLAELLKAGVEGVRAAGPDMPVMMHLALGGQNDEATFWLDNMIARDVQFDVIGLSYYPRWHATLSDLYANTHDLLDRYGLPINVVEYGWFAPEIHEIVFGLPDGRGQGTFSWEPLRGFFDDDGMPTDALLQYDDLAARYLGTPE